MSCLNVITAGNDGIGFSLLQQLSKMFPGDQFIVTHRKDSSLELLNSFLMDSPSSISLIALDALNDDDYEKLKDLSSQMDKPIRYVLNTIGLLEMGNYGPERKLGDLNITDASKIIAVNSLPIVKIVGALKKKIRKSPELRVASLSAKVGSISDNDLGGWYSYRMGKSAMNMAIKNIAIECSRLNPESTCVAIHPGTTETKLTKNFIENARKKYQVHSSDGSAKNIIQTIEKARLEKSTGQFYNWDGEPLPW
ncbi:MAG: SDR family NAD(P)-dependent oxidoreductase [Bdellovibrionales bacterium]